MMAHIGYNGELETPVARTKYDPTSWWEEFFEANPASHVLNPEVVSRRIVAQLPAHTTFVSMPYREDEEPAILCVW